MSSLSYNFRVCFLKLYLSITALIIPLAVPLFNIRKILKVKELRTLSFYIALIVMNLHSDLGRQQVVISR